VKRKTLYAAQALGRV